MNGTIPSLPVTRDMRRRLGIDDTRYDKRGRLKISSPREARDLALRLGRLQGGPPPPAADLYGAAFIYTAWRLMLKEFGQGHDPFEPRAVEALRGALSGDDADRFLVDVSTAFADESVWHGRRTPGESALRETQARTGRRRLSGRERTLRTFVLNDLAAGNPAFTPFADLFSAPDLQSGSDGTVPGRVIRSVEAADTEAPPREPDDDSPLATLKNPIEAAPDSVRDQLLYILTRWGRILGDWTHRLVGVLDMIEEETRPRFGGGPGPVRRPGLGDLDGEARFSSDHDWMPEVVMLAKNVLVWLDQLSKRYGEAITTLDAVPDDELDILASRGFNALWLIGLWERSHASREIKRRMGNPEAAASAYSLFGYDIDPALGGWEAMENLRHRAARRGIRMSSDMVPNHVGIDSDWVRQHPDRLLSAGECPYPAYGWNSENLSGDPGIDIRLEDHYWDRSDAAVVFRRVDNHTGGTRYIYHGNDGTSMPWNDTAQIDFLNPEAREAVIRDILHVARNFSIIRFDAAMVLARKSIRRLWYPAPGAGGAIPSRSEFALTDEQFDEACPTEFWREVVDRVAEEIPGTLLLAEAFWMMEGYFVRSLGMHRVYNSAFMNMLRDGKNNEYRAMMKETLAFDPGILQRYVNFMNNPDEETAVEQFGKDDRYFATATLLATLPGLPMFGHGQIEGLSEKYGMEYVKAYRDEHPDPDLIDRHEREIFPLIRRRSRFAGAESFRLYDLSDGGAVNENVFAYTNADAAGPVLVVVNNAWERAGGTINHAAPVKLEDSMRNDSLGSALVPSWMNDGDWVLLRNHLDGLWYLRRAGDLRSGGLTIAIDGYGRQVFLDFRHERETRDGMWGRLAAELNGAGVADPDDALAAIRLRPLHEALSSLLSREYLVSAAGMIRRGRIPSWPDSTDRIRAVLKAHEQLSGETTIVGPEEIDSRIRSRLAGASRFRRFSGLGSRRLRRVADRRFPAREQEDDETLLVLQAVTGTLAEAVAGDTPVSQQSHLWGLDRWMREAGLTGLSGQLPSRFAAAAAGSKMMAQDSGHGPGGALAELMSDSAFRDACGVNTWDGVIWFGEAEWNRSVRAAVLAAGIVASGGLRALRTAGRLRRALRAWHRSAGDSDFRLEALLNRSR